MEGYFALRRKKATFSGRLSDALHANAGGHPEGGGDGGEYGDYDVKDLAPGFFCHLF